MRTSCGLAKAGLVAATVVAIALAAPAPVWARQSASAPGSAPATPAVRDSNAIRIVRGGTQPSRQGPAENFTGSVRVDPLFQAASPARASGAIVTFEAGARSAWHTHPLGQVLIVTAGSGWVQPWGGPKQEIQQGDVVWIPPDLKHWHGATATAGMTHTAIQERLDGRNVDWMEHVTDAQYRG